MDQNSSDRKEEEEVASQRISYADVASKLLEDRFLLTALELHFELTEAGREIPKLKEFFSNPGNFEIQSNKPEFSSTVLTRWSSQGTLDSLDLTRYSEDGERVIDDRVVVLEFELRKAKETINALRANLTVATECENQSQSGEKVASAGCEPIKPHEQRALNFLINEYLLLYGYKLTSITFAEENEQQDFEVWDDVGLNIPKPPELLYLYRDAMKRAGICTNAVTFDTECQTDITNEECEVLISERENLKHRISELEEERSVLQENIERLKKENALENAMRHVPAPPSECGSLQDHYVVVEPTNQGLSGSQKTELLESELDREKNLHIEPKEEILFEKSDEAEISPRKRKGDTTLEDEDRDSLSSCSNSDWTKCSSENLELKKEVTENVIIKLIQKSRRNLPLEFQRELISSCYIDPGTLPSENIMDISDTSCIDLDDVVRVFAKCLRAIVPDILSTKKYQEIMILLVYLIRLHPEEKMREKLLHILLGLKKRPHENERKIILAGLTWLVRFCNSDFVENELLPTFWEHLNHKYSERRLLTSEACCCITPYLSDCVRTSVLLPILQQMLLEDKDENVRSCVLKSIALITALIEEDEKYPQCEELVFTGLQDSSSSVVQCTIDTLLPVLAKWSFDTDRFQTHLMSRLINLLSSQIKSLSNQKDVSIPFKCTLFWEVRCTWTTVAMRSLLPYLIMSTAAVDEVLSFSHHDLPRAQPRTGFSNLCRGLYNPATFYEGSHTVGEVMSAFDFCVSDRMWPQLEWITVTMVPQLLDCLERIMITHRDFLSCFVSLFHSFASGFGKIATRVQIKPIFENRLASTEKKLANLKEEWPSLSVLPVFLLAILVPLEDIDRIEETLRKFIFALPLVGYPLDVLQFCIKELSHLGTMEDKVIDILWDGVVHQRDVIRCSIPKLFDAVIPDVTQHTIANRIMPALLTLSNDPDVNVRAATIPLFGSLIMKSTVKEVRDKCYFQLQTFLSDPNVCETHPVLMQLIVTLSDIAPNCDPAFREDVIAHYLNIFRSYTVMLQSMSRKQDLLRVLINAYSSLVYCPLSQAAVQSTLMPSLRCLQNITEECAPNRRNAVNLLVKDAETRYSVNSAVATSTTIVGQDMKQKMSKIFQGPIAKSGRFWKK